MGNILPKTKVIGSCALLLLFDWKRMNFSIFRPLKDPQNISAVKSRIHDERPIARVNLKPRHCWQSAMMPMGS